MIVGETGWPSCGNTIYQAVPTPENAGSYFLNFVSWARAKNVSYFYFEAFDESWKATAEGPQGACWGLWDKNGNMKPGMGSIFAGSTMADNWTGGPDMAFIYVPPIGSTDDLKGQVWHVNPAGYGVAVYIKVGGGWWTKPTFANPLTPIPVSGSWTCDITTGGYDPQATEIAAYLVPNSYVPPRMEGQSSLPPELDQNAIAKTTAVRTP